MPSPRLDAFSSQLMVSTGLTMAQTRLTNCASYGEVTAHRQGALIRTMAGLTLQSTSDPVPDLLAASF